MFIPSQAHPLGKPSTKMERKDFMLVVFQQKKKHMPKH